MVDVVGVDHRQRGGQVGGGLYAVAIDHCDEAVFTEAADVDVLRPHAVAAHEDAGFIGEAVGDGERRPFLEFQ